MSEPLEPAEDVVLITGASSDIGRELLRQLAAEPGCGAIVAHARSGADKLEALRREIPALAERLHVVRADLASESELRELIDTVRLRHGRPTRIVHLAAPRLELRRAAELEWKPLAADLEIQLRSIAAILAAFLPAMAKSARRCKVVFMLSSVTIGAPPKFMAQYTVGKFALLGLMRALAVEYADKPVCFNAVSPSMVDTQFLAGVPGKFVQMAAAAHPAKRNARVEDVVPAIRFLLSPESDYVSGANFPVTAGSAL